MTEAVVMMVMMEAEVRAGLEAAVMVVAMEAVVRAAAKVAVVRAEARRRW